MTDRPSNQNPTAVELLNQALELEYTLIIHYPMLAGAIQDEETRGLVLKLGTDSVHHADVVASAITRLGGVPRWQVEPFPADDDLINVFKQQLQKEQLALALHRQNAALAQDKALKDSFAGLQKDEQTHIQLVETILERLARESRQSLT